MTGLTDFADSGRIALKLMTLEYTNVSEGNFTDEPVVELFCRDADGERHQINVHDYYPHFYVTEDEFVSMKDDLLQETSVRSIEVDTRLLTEEEQMNGSITPLDSPPKETLLGTDLVKINTVVPSDVADLRDLFDQHWEADVFFTNRFLIDSGIKLGLSVPAEVMETDDTVKDVSFDEIAVLDEGDEPQVSPRMVTVDIEVWSGGEFPDTQDPDKPVTAITAHDTYDDEYFCGVLHPDAVEQGENHTWPDNPDWEAPDNISDDELHVNVYMRETELLGAFNSFVAEKDPDLLTGWNSSRNDIGSGFDYPYIINRCERINDWTYTNLGYENGRIFVTNRGTPVIGGREMFDMLQAYKKTQIHEKRSYSLEYIASEELGYGKEDIDGLDEGWLHNPVEFMRYNIRDTEAVVEIEAAKSVVDMYDHVRSITGATYSEIADSNIGIIDMLFLRAADERGYALPTSERPDVQHYWGAYVFEPVAGKHENVVYPDLKCFTPDHDVLTTDGLKAITEVEVGDTVYSINPKTGAVEKQPVIQTYEYPEYDGETVSFEGTRVDFEVTPNHRMLYQNGDSYYFEEAGEFDGQRRVLPNPSNGVDGPGIDEFDLTDYIDTDCYDIRATYTEHGHSYRSKLPDGCEKKRANYHEGFFFNGDIFKEYQNELEELSGSLALSHPDGGGSTFRPYKFDGDDFIELLGWFISEGSVYYPDDDTTTAVVQIVQETNDKSVESLFERLGITYSETDSSYTVGSKIYGDFFTKYTGEDSFSKTIPEFIFERASLEQKELLLGTLMKGDGHRNTYYTSSQQLAEDVCRLATECAHKAKISRRRETEYEVVITDTSDGINSYQESSTTAEDGVYCIEVAENNTMLAGKNSKMQWVGNSLYPNLFRDMNASPETIIGDEAALRESEYSAEDCQIIYVDQRDEDEKQDADEPEREELYVLKPSVKESFVREIVGDMIDMKYEYKKDEYSDEAYAAVKRITNSVYGVMGDSKSYGKGFRLFDWRIAEAITLAGRDVIKHTANEFVEKVREMGYDDAEIIAGDTDSAVCEIASADGSYENAPYSVDDAREYISQHDDLSLDGAGEDSNIHETLVASMKAAEYVDATYEEFMEDRFGITNGNMAVEIESYSTAALFMDKKKRYAQDIRWDEGDYVKELEYKGFELVRSDSAESTGTVQKGVIERILRSDEPKNVVKEYLMEEWNDILDGNVAVEQIGIPSAINNSPMDYGWSVQQLKEKDAPMEREGEVLEEGDDVVKYYTPQPNIRGARYATEYIDGEDISQGDKPLLVYVSRVRPVGDIPETYQYTHLSLNAPHDVPDANQREMKEIDRDVDAICVEDVSNISDDIVLDYEKMASKTIRDPVEPIVEVMGWDFQDLVTEGEQMDLANYF